MDVFSEPGIPSGSLYSLIYQNLSNIMVDLYTVSKGSCILNILLIRFFHQHKMYRFIFQTFLVLIK